MINDRKSKLERQLLSTPRLLEFFNIDSLRSATGQSEDQWDLVFLKELVDNGLDVCEMQGISPVIRVELNPGSNGELSLKVSDNGPGMPLEVIEKVFDIERFASSKAEYKAPTRGAQGNALKTILGIPIALGLSGEGDKIIPITVESLGQTYHIEVDYNPNKHHVAVNIVNSQSSIFSKGTVITVRFPLIRDWAKTLARFQDMISAYHIFNPHVTFVFNDKHMAATDTGFKKFKIDDHTSPWWYSAEDLARLIYSHNANGFDKDLRKFVSEFKGLSHSARKVCQYLPEIRRLSDFKREDPQIKILLEKMRHESGKPPRPNVLGILGEEHFRRVLNQDEIKYKRIGGICNDDQDNDNLDARIPYILEMAVAHGKRKDWIGVNFSSSYANPFLLDSFEITKRKSHWKAYGYNDLLEKFKVEDSDDLVIIVHLVCPNLQYTDRSKSEFTTTFFNKALGECFYQTLKGHYREKKRLDRGIPGKTPPRAGHDEEIKKAVFEVLPMAIEEISDNGTIVFSAKHLHYVVRRLIQEITDKELIYKYFSPSLLTEYQKLYGPIEGLYYDPRGYMTHPHTKDVIPLGTREVEIYKIPDYLYNKVLYMEKKGLLPIFENAKFLERFDIAIMAGEGYASRAAKHVLDEFEGVEEIKFFCIHDADIDGLNIARTLQKATKTAGERKIEVIDLGLSPSEAKAKGLQFEKAIYRKTPPQAVLDSLTQEDKEIWNLRDTRESNADPPRYEYQRCELDALSPRQLMNWLEAKLQEHGATAKVIPPLEVVNNTYQGTIANEVDKACEAAIDEVLRSILSLDQIKAYIKEKAREALKNNIKTNIFRELEIAFAGNPPVLWRDYLAGEASRVVDHNTIALISREELIRHLRNIPVQISKFEDISNQG